MILKWAKLFPIKTSINASESDELQQQDKSKDFLVNQNNRESELNFPASPKSFTSKRGAPKPLLTFKAGFALSREVVCVWKPEAMANPSTSQKLWKGGARTVYTTD